MSRRRKNEEAPRPDLAGLEEVLGHRFADRSLLERALVHSSAASEGLVESNQTLEFLGDAVLDLAVSEFLLQRHPGRAEGELTRMRAGIVSARGLAAAATRLDLGRWIRLGRGEQRSGGGRKANILADTYEAVVAAVFLDRGYEAARGVIESTFAAEIAAADTIGGDWKTELQELTQALYHGPPSYSLVSVTGPDHERHFEVAIRVAGEVVGRGEGSNRKGAEQVAAQQAVALLKSRPLPPEVSGGGSGAAPTQPGQACEDDPAARADAQDNDGAAGAPRNPDA